jgi:hypothetical protein
MGSFGGRGLMGWRLWVRVAGDDYRPGTLECMIISDRTCFDYTQELCQPC